MTKVNTRIDFFCLSFLARHGRGMVAGVGELLVKTEKILINPSEPSPRHVFKHEVLSLVPDCIAFLGLM